MIKELSCLNSFQRKMFFEKLDRNITGPYISKPIEVTSQIQLKYTIVKDPNILKESFVNRVKKKSKLQSEILCLNFRIQ